MINDTYIRTDVTHDNLANFNDIYIENLESTTVLYIFYTLNRERYTKVKNKTFKFILL